MQNKINVIMRKDIYKTDMDIVLLPRDIFQIEGYSPANIDDTSLIDDYVSQSMSGLTENDSIELYINYGFTRALVSTLNVIFKKNLDCNINIYDNESDAYVSFGKLKPQAAIHGKESGEPVGFQLINRTNKMALPEFIQHVFAEEEIKKEQLFDADYFNRVAYESLKDYTGRHVYLYITGLKQALIACVNASRQLDIRMTMKHYNPDDESYEHEQELYIA